MKTYIFPIEFEEAEGAWHVCVPELESFGAVTWSKTQEEALRNMQEVMQMLIEELLEEGEELPPCVQVSERTAVAVCV